MITQFFLVLLLTSTIAAAMSPARDQQQKITAGAPRHHDLKHEGRRRRLAAISNESDSARLRSELLSNYDKGSFPFNHLWNETADDAAADPKQGLSVGFDMNFHKVLEIDVTNSVVDLVVWVRQQWEDPRLVWDPDEYGGIQTAWFWIDSGSGPGGETSEIWTPDIELWNMEESLSTSLTSTHATVKANGTVSWSRPGHIKPVCKFRGLDDFPFDKLSCTMELGSWSFSGMYIRPVLMGGIGYSIGGSKTAGEAFAEYTLSSVNPEEHIYPPFSTAPMEDWPVIFYHLEFDRAWEPYARGYLVLQIVLNLVAFCCFWLPPHIGERMGLAITAVLAAVASELVISEKLPAASDVTWFSKFSIASLIFAASALFESAAVIYFYYHTGDDLVPQWFKWLRRKMKGEKDDPEKPDETSDPSSGPSSSSNDDFMENGEELTDTQNWSTSGREGSQRLNSIVDNKRNATEGPSKRQSDFSFGDVEDDELEGGQLEKTTSVRFEDDTETETERRRHSALSFHRKLSNSTRKGIKTVLGRDADDFKNAKEMTNNLRWQKISMNIDSFSRVFFPAAYIVFLAVALAGSLQ